jgi:hypothetical protein
MSMKPATWEVRHRRRYGDNCRLFQAEESIVAYFVKSRQGEPADSHSAEIGPHRGALSIGLLLMLS